MSPTDKPLTKRDIYRQGKVIFFLGGANTKMFLCFSMKAYRVLSLRLNQFKRFLVDFIHPTGTPLTPSSSTSFSLSLPLLHATSIESL